jgi:hypothetical protein
MARRSRGLRLRLRPRKKAREGVGWLRFFSIDATLVSGFCTNRKEASVDKNVWRIIRNAIRAADRRVARQGRRPAFSDRMIVKMYFWSVAHDRPRCFATQRGNYTAVFRPRQLPSYSQFCRRLHAPRVVAMIECVNERLADSTQPFTLAFIDGKAMAVSESSKDPDARTGRGHGKFSRGYKLHALVSDDGRIRLFAVRPMNEAEPRVSREHIMPYLPAGVLVIGDGNYDSKFLYQIASERGSWFFAPPKKAPQQRRSWRRTNEARREAVEVWEQRPRLARAVYKLRSEIERVFSRLSCFGGGLAPLPAWVRRLDRVTLWVTAKIALYHARLILRERQRIAA